MIVFFNVINLKRPRQYTEVRDMVMSVMNRLILLKGESSVDGLAGWSGLEEASVEQVKVN